VFFCGVNTCGLIEIPQCFGETITLIMEAVGSSKVNSTTLHSVMSQKMGFFVVNPVRIPSLTGLELTVLHHKIHES
jgi:hypothetical protein